MGYVLHDDESARSALRRIAREQVERALEELHDEHLDTGKVVHQVRKRCKKVRGLLRLVRGSIGSDYREANRWFRDAARVLSEQRDADTRLATFQALGDVEPALRHDDAAPLRDALQREREEIRSAAGKELFRDVTERMEAALGRIDDWSLEHDGFDAFGEGFAKTYRRGCKAMERATREPSPEAFHQWRKRVEYHGYHVRLLRRAWQQVLQPQRKAVEELADLLGLDHDLAVLRAHVVESPERFARTPALASCLLAIDRRRSDLASRARLLGRRVHAESARSLSDRFARYWRAWRAERGPAGVQAMRA